MRICQRYFKNIKILLCQVNFTNYDYDKCQRKNRRFFSLNSSSPAKVSQKRAAPNVLGILQENVFESLIF